MKKSPANAAAKRSPLLPEPPLGRAVVSWAQALGRNEDIVRRVEAKVRRVRRRRTAAAGALALFLLAGVVWYSRLLAPPFGHVGASTALVTLPAQQTLPDGSIVALKDHARIVAHFTAEGNEPRRVTLESGEAHFAVAKNPARPFVVVAGGLEVRAVGTAFAVELGSRQIAVLVTEGQVNIERASPAAANAEAEPAPAVRLGAGKRLIVDRSAEAKPLPAPEAMPEDEVETRLAWRVPRIRFADTPLSEAVAVFNRYSSSRLVLDPALAELRIGGVVRADNTDSFLRLLKNEFGIARETDAGGTVHLRRP